MPTPVPDAPPARAAVSATADGYHDARDQRAARELLSAEVTHVVFGHTHHVVDAAETGLAYTNPGTWLPRLDLRSERVRQSIEHGITLEVLQDESLYVAQRLAVRIVPAASGPSEVSLEQFT